MHGTEGGNRLLECVKAKAKGWRGLAFESMLSLFGFGQIMERQGGGEKDSIPHLGDRLRDLHHTIIISNH